jgi:hypothetical protein
MQIESHVPLGLCRWGSLCWREGIGILSSMGIGPEGQENISHETFSLSVVFPTEAIGIIG